MRERVIARFVRIDDEQHVEYHVGDVVYGLVEELRAALGGR